MEPTNTLHTMNASPTSGMLEDFRALLNTDDGLLFIEDGVFHTAIAPAELQLPATVKCYALREDCLARGVLERCHRDYEIIDYAGFVSLCTHFDKIISWF